MACASRADDWLLHCGDRRFASGFGPRQRESIRPCRLAPQRLDRAAPRLLIDASHSGGECRPRGETSLWPRLRLHEQIREPRARVFAIAGLAREALGENDDHAILCGARPRELDQPDRDVVRQAGLAARVEPKLDRARHLVDVLPART